MFIVFGAPGPQKPETECIVARLRALLNVCLSGYGQAARPISTGLLRALQRFHIQPINLVVYKGPLVPCGRDT